MVIKIKPETMFKRLCKSGPVVLFFKANESENGKNREYVNIMYEMDKKMRYILFCELDWNEYKKFYNLESDVKMNNISVYDKHVILISELNPDAEQIINIFDICIQCFNKNIDMKIEKLEKKSKMFSNSIKYVTKYTDKIFKKKRYYIRRKSEFLKMKMKLNIPKEICATNKQSNITSKNIRNDSIYKNNTHSKCINPKFVSSTSNLTKNNNAIKNEIILNLNIDKLYTKHEIHRLIYKDDKSIILPMFPPNKHNKKNIFQIHKPSPKIPNISDSFINEAIDLTTKIRKNAENKSNILTNFTNKSHGCYIFKNHISATQSSDDKFMTNYFQKNKYTKLGESVYYTNKFSTNIESNISKIEENKLIKFNLDHVSDHSSNKIDSSDYTFKKL